MSLRERNATEKVLDARERYVAAGVSTPPLVVARAEGARVEDVDGRTYVDFAGGLGCQNTGHGLPPAVAAMHEQIDRYLHQCFMVGIYEPYVELCRRLAELSACRGAEQKSLLVNSGAEAVENAVKIARAATGRPAVIVLDRGFHGRTTLTLAMTSKVVPYKLGFGPLAPEVYRVPAPYPLRGVTMADATHGIEALFKQDVAPSSVACVVIEPVQGEGGFIVMPPEFLSALRGVCDEHGIVFVADEIQSGVGRTGRVWAMDHAGVEPDLLVSGKSLGGGLPLAAVTGRGELMDAVGPGGLGGTFGGNPVACAAAAGGPGGGGGGGFQQRAAAVGESIRSRLDAIEHPAVAEVRGLGPMLAMELAEQTPALANAVTAAARERGLVLLSCGLYGNGIRILAPFVATDDELGRGLDILEEALDHGSRSAG